MQPQEPPPSDPSKDAPPKPKEVELVDCFEGLEQQVRPQDVAAEVLSGRVFLRQFESTDPVFRMMVKDSTNEVFTKKLPGAVPSKTGRSFRLFLTISGSKLAMKSHF